MKAIRIAASGDPQVMQWQDITLPPPGPGEVQLRHTAIGLNFIDTYHRSGLYPLPMPSGLGLEAAGGTAWGALPVQRAWFLGGARTLRGYPGASAVGSTFVRGRAELARQMGAVSVSAFSDAGWAGPRDRIRLDDALVSAGVGASALDGLVRVDLARALRAPTGWRLELYVDAIL